MNETKLEREAREQFERNTADHTMEILHNDGVYRHLKFSNNGSSIYRYDLITYPGHLVISGDMDSFTFKRLYDMFDFFTTPRGGIINPQYWSEKIIASSKGTTKHFSADKAKCAVVERFMEDRLQWDDGTAPLFRALREEVLDVLTEVGDGIESPDVAKKAMSEFAYYKPPAPGEKPRPRWERGNYPDYTLDDWYEFDMEEYDFHFLWICHAIRHGVQTYREAGHAIEPERTARPIRSIELPPGDGERNPGSQSPAGVGGRGRHAADSPPRSVGRRVAGWFGIGR
jgi:hypothetical protein